MEKYLTINKTARYSQFGIWSEKVEMVWIILHGYGQLSPYFINKFKSLENDKNIIVVPEGIHRFYIQRNTGRVGACWMTKEEREADIADNNSYLDLLYKIVMKDKPKGKKVILNALGFSQGAATLCRWAAMGKGKINNLILWAGMFPPDLPLDLASEKFKKMKLFFLLGDNDEFANQDEVQKELKRFEGHGLHFHFIAFEGKHDVYEKPLIKLVEMVK
jgi:predicted esterase